MDGGVIGPLVGEEELRRRIWPGDGVGGAGLSRAAFYELLARDQTFPRLRLGGRTYYPEAEVRVWLGSRMQGGANADAQVQGQVRGPKRRRRAQDDVEGGK